MKCPMCMMPLALSSYEQIWVHPDFQHRFTYYCESCNLRFGAESYERAELIQTEPKQSQEPAQRPEEIEV